jgi:hypothetical protein
LLAIDYSTDPASERKKRGKKKQEPSEQTPDTGRNSTGTGLKLQQFLPVRGQHTPLFLECLAIILSPVANENGSRLVDLVNDLSNLKNLSSEKQNEMCSRCGTGMAFTTNEDTSASSEI